MAENLSDTIVDKILSANGDTNRSLIIIASYMDDMRNDVSAINQRLEKGDITMTDIKKSIEALPCERPASECATKPSGWGKTTVISSGIATAIITVIEVVKNYYTKGAS